MFASESTSHRDRLRSVLNDWHVAEHGIPALLCDNQAMSEAAATVNGDATDSTPICRLKRNQLGVPQANQPRVRSSDPLVKHFRTNTSTKQMKSSATQLETIPQASEQPTKQISDIEVSEVSQTAFAKLLTFLTAGIEPDWELQSAPPTKTKRCGCLHVLTD